MDSTTKSAQLLAYPPSVAFEATLDIVRRLKLTGITCDWRALRISGWYTGDDDGQAVVIHVTPDALKAGRCSVDITATPISDLGEATARLRALDSAAISADARIMSALNLYLGGASLDDVARIMKPRRRSAWLRVIFVLASGIFIVMILMMLLTYRMRLQ